MTVLAVVRFSAKFDILWIFIGLGDNLQPSTMMTTVIAVIIDLRPCGTAVPSVFTYFSSFIWFSSRSKRFC